MADGFKGYAGIMLGCSGRWQTRPGERCQLVVVADGLLEQLDTLRSLMFGNYKIGLYQNDREPILNDTMAAFVECNFSGYDGRHLLYGWTSPQMRGTRAFTQAAEQSWEYNGGPVTNLVYGYFVVNNAGLLRFAERFCDGPFSMDVSGRVFKITPTYTLKNEREEQ